MLTEKDYCDYKLVLELKELGYDYIRREGLIHLYDAQKWLREEKRICVEVDCCASGYVWELCKAYQGTWFSGGTTIYTPNDVGNPQLNDAGRYDDFETCLSEGIKEAVKILKEK